MQKKNIITYTKYIALSGLALSFGFVLMKDTPTSTTQFNKAYADAIPSNDGGGMGTPFCIGYPQLCAGQDNNDTTIDVNDNSDDSSYDDGYYDDGSYDYDYGDCWNSGC